MDGTLALKKYNLMNGEGGGGGTASDNIAPTFSETSQYIYGDLVFYEGQLYRFEDEHEPGPWNPEEVMATSINENLVMLPGDGLRRTMHEFSVKLKSDGGLHFDQNGAIYADHLPDYRLLEHDTKQQWIDGSHIYAKTIEFGALPVSTQKDVSSGLTGVNIIKMEAVATSTDDTLFVPYNAANNFIGLLYVYATNSIRIWSNTDLSNHNAFVTLYYTKNSQTSKKKK